MTHTQLTTSEAALIHGYLISGLPISKISQLTNRSRPTIYRVKHWIDTGKSISDWSHHCHDMRHHRGRHRIQLSDTCLHHIKQFLSYGYSPDVIAHTQNIGCSTRSIYRLAQCGILSVPLLPWKGKRRKNHHSEKRGRLTGAVSIHERKHVFPDYASTFGHWEGDTIVGKGRHSCVITLVERLSKRTPIVNKIIPAMGGVRSSFPLLVFFLFRLPWKKPTTSEKNIFRGSRTPVFKTLLSERRKRRTIFQRPGGLHRQFEK